MNFRDLFSNCKQQLKQEILNIWLGDKELWNGNRTLKSDVYTSQLNELLDKCLNGDNILVEDLGEWESVNTFPTNLLPNGYWREFSERDTNGNNISKEEASIATNNVPLVSKPYQPFLHQMESWEKLLQDNKSICVTSGTGSGKTECFMVPLVKDLADNYVARHANGAIGPEPIQAIFLYPLNALMDDQRTRMSECVECCGQDLTFAVYNGNTPNDIDDTYRDGASVGSDRRKHELVFRDEIQSGHPNILFTNPTMLEYMLIRNADRGILTHSQGQLRWIVIDETHTFSGAGAAELALLIRRVLDAFGTDINNVRFATSSATVGQGGDEKLQKFISKITCKNENDIEIISGHRSLQIINGTRYQQLHDSVFLTLNEMIPEGQDVEDKLDHLDQLCNAGLRVKLHLFVKALNRGLYINPTQDNNGAFTLLDAIPLDTNTGRFNDLVLEAKFCSHCGAVLAAGTIDDQNNLKRNIIETSSIFDNVSTDDDDDDDDNDNDNNNDSSNNTATNDILVARGNQTEGNGQNGHLNGSSLTPGTPTDNYVYIQSDSICPVCGASGTIKPFRVSADKVARIIAPKLLEQGEAFNVQNLLFEGKQMISFADSRAKAAKPSLKQNKEMESKWVEWVVFSNLQQNQQQAAIMLSQQQSMLQMAITNYNQLPNAINLAQLQDIQQRVNDLQFNTLSWMDAISALQADIHFDYFAKQFAHDGDLDNNGNCTPEYQNRYALAALYEVFNRRPKKKWCAETRGQIQIVYPKVEMLRNQPQNHVLPQSVQVFNTAVTDPANQISLSDWCDLLTLYLDHKVRTHQALYFQAPSYANPNSDWSTIDIDACRNLRTQDGVRRSAKINKNNKRFTDILGKLLGCDYDALPNNDNRKILIDDVMNTCWEVLRNPQNLGILEVGQTYKKRIIHNNITVQQAGWYDSVVGGPIQPMNYGRMNLTQLSFKLPEPNTIKICPITNRYIASTFKNYSPYRDENNRYGTLVQNVAPQFIEPIQEPQLFIQSEHTAQLGRKLTKQRVKDFKDHKINVLACSTTMEMGVDLGSVLLVQMTNIPPHPANYKQRAGRAGRRGQTRSACVTICGSDGVDARFFNDSKNSVTRQIEPPTVDLNSPQVVQRHINSYLFLQWSQTVNFSDEVKDLFTNYQWQVDQTTGKLVKSQVVLGANSVTPNGGDQAIPYDQNHTINALWSDFYNYLQQIAPFDANIRLGLRTIVDGIPSFVNNLDNSINNTAISIRKLWEELDQYFTTLKDLQAVAEQSHQNDPALFSQDRLDKRKRALNYDFTSRLSENLLTYLSNHQFLPNANMPVHIVELKKSDTNGIWVNSGYNENPSYDIATALGQWAPSNYVTIKDTTYQIGGIQFDYERSWIKIQKCNHCGHTWTTQDTTCPNCGSNDLVTWKTNGGKELKLVEPTAFVPTLDRSRITDNSKNYTIAKAELIGASPMRHPAKGWVAHRVSDLGSTETPRILLYNDGMGYGYKICRKCGKTEIEVGPVNPNNMDIDIQSFYKMVSTGNNNLRYHADLPSNNGPCFFNQGVDIFNQKVYRNMIIGGLIQTDYCEMQLYKQVGIAITPLDNNDDRKILTTLGILICSYMVDTGICERSDIDFIVMGGGRLCIFDKAKGGAGYSKQLDNQIETALDYCRNRLGTCTDMFQFLDSFSQRHAENVDINSTRQWLNDEANNRDIIPQQILNIYTNAQNSSFIEVEQIINSN